ncbi:hypothetical protein OROHE_012400 [Orobanche hederae]
MSSSTTYRQSFIFYLISSWPSRSKTLSSISFLCRQSVLQESLRSRFE